MSKFASLAVLFLTCIMPLTPGARAEADWVKSLPVPAGTSIKEEAKSDEIKIRIQTIQELREGTDFFWVAGLGIAINQKYPGFGWTEQTIKPFEITIMKRNSADWALDNNKAPRWSDCFEILRSNRSANISGLGEFKKVEIKNYSVGIYRFDQLISCDSVRAATMMNYNLPDQPASNNNPANGQ